MTGLAVLGGDLDVVVRDGVIAGDVDATGLPVLDATGCVVGPGFVELQCNGGFGIDLASEPERLWELAGRLPSTGVTSWLPTIVTTPPPVAERAAAALRHRPEGAAVVAEPLGLHLEGPFLSPARRGAHPASLLSAIDGERAGAWSPSSGVALVTLAPELPGALELVPSLTARGVVVSAGHSEATVEEMRAAADAGVRMVTHLFNAMAPLHHRAPGIAGAALVDERLHVGVIADGVHLHPTAVAVAWRCLGERLVLVTDAVAGMGSSDGDAQRLADGTLAGGLIGMDQAVRNLVEFAGCPLGDAMRAASAAPASVLGAGDRGGLRPGMRGDLVVLTPAGDLVATVIAGTIAWQAP